MAVVIFTMEASPRRVPLLRQGEGAFRGLLFFFFDFNLPKRRVQVQVGIGHLERDPVREVNFFLLLLFRARALARTVG